jgi:dTDP-4-dehydrorhamnose 3,5-epimerase
MRSSSSRSALIFSYCAPEPERTIAWNDPELAISSPLQGEAVLSPKDRAGVRFRDAEVFA